MISPQPGTCTSAGQAAPPPPPPPLWADTLERAPLSFPGVSGRGFARFLWQLLGDVARVFFEGCIRCLPYAWLAIPPRSPLPSQYSLLRSGCVLLTSAACLRRGGCHGGRYY